MTKLNHLDWDSKFFNRNIYSCSIEGAEKLTTALNLISNSECDLCYIFSKQKLDVADTAHFFLADVKITFYKNEFKPAANDTVSEIISYHNLTEQLVNLSILSGQHSRFNLDPKLQPDYNRMYKTWIEKSLFRQIADEVFVYEQGGSQFGFVTVKSKDESATIGLIAVDSQKQGEGIGTALLNSVELWCIENAISHLEVATQQQNKQACSFYERNGFEIKKVDYIYHYHRS